MGTIMRLILTLNYNGFTEKGWSKTKISLWGLASIVACMSELIMDALTFGTLGLIPTCCAGILFSFAIDFKIFPKWSEMFFSLPFSSAWDYMNPLMSALLVLLFL